MDDFTDGFDNDVNNDGYDSELIEVTSAAEVEMTVSTRSFQFRQWVRIFNKGPGRIEIGPQGKPKEVLFRNQGVTINHGDNNKVYATALSVDCDVLVTESG
jgi:hypothetical protein